MQTVNNPAAKKAAPKKRAPKRPAADQDFDAYRNWVREAFSDETILSDQDIAENWASLSNEYKADFVTATREFKDAEQARAAPNTRLIDALKAVLALSDPEGGNRVSTRVLAADAKRHHETLTEALKLREAATADISSHLDALDQVLQTRAAGRFETYLQDHQQELRKIYDTELRRDRDWLTLCRPFADAKGTSNEVKLFKNFAQDIKNSLELPHPPSDRDTSSQKRKRQSENDDAEPDARGATGPAATLRSNSARPGASQLRPPEAAVGDEQVEDREQDQEDYERSDQAQPRQHNLGGLPPPTIGNNDVGGIHRQPQIGGQDAAPGSEPLPLPEIGNIGPHTQALRFQQDTLPPNFKSWCRRQLMNARDRSPEAVETLVAVFWIIYEKVLPDHDWENEDDVPQVGAVAFQHRWPAERPWPNIRRLLRMTRGGPEACRVFVDRHFDDARTTREDADQHALTILQWIHYGGLHQDWDRRDDQFITKKEADQTKSILLDALNRDGHWQFKDVVGEGGNGRAALYVKLNEHGQILQRIVSKESFIGKFWNSPSSWYGEVNDRVPIEAGLHRLLPNHRHIIEYLGFHLNKRLRMVRLYTAFAQLGDLLDLIDTHKELESLKDEHGRSLEAKSPVPNLAVLYIFEAMAASVCLMAHGVLPEPDIKGNWPDNDGQVSWDHNIIHRDIKANNFFLSASSSDQVWPGLPVAALGDFGNAIDAADPVYAWRPSWARDAGTPGYMAPEQVEQPIEGAYEHSITSATNVYQIGVSMLHLMIRSRPRFQPEFGKSEAGFFKRNPDDCYDAGMAKLAWDCAEMDPTDRPSARDLYIRLRTLARAYPNADGDHSVPYQFMQLKPTEMVRTAPDKYAHLLA